MLLICEKIVVAIAFECDVAYVFSSGGFHYPDLLIVGFSVGVQAVYDEEFGLFAHQFLRHTQKVSCIMFVFGVCYS